MNHIQVPHPDELLKRELNAWQGFKKDFAVGVTTKVGTVEAAGVFCVIALAGAVAIVTNNATLGLIVSLISQTFLQLVLLPIIMVGQNVQQEQSQAKADADHQALTHIATQVDKIVGAP